MSNVLADKYRPVKFDQLVGTGQKQIAKTIKGVLDRDSHHSFLLIGPSGVGKTTLARIAATYLGCPLNMVNEIDAATKTGVDDMRAVQELAMYLPLGNADTRVIIVDECHMLSKGAWNSLLKITEKPPAHVYWFFCTTEMGKIPPTIKTRSMTFTLPLVADKELGQLFDHVCETEKIDVPGDVGDLIIRESSGSPRQMLTYLETCREAKTRQEAAALLQSADASDKVIEFCRMLTNGGATWNKLMSLVSDFPETAQSESVRIILRNYAGAALKKSNNSKAQVYLLRVLDAFEGPYNASEGISPLLVSIGRVLYGAN